MVIVGVDSDAQNFGDWSKRRQMILSPTSSNTYEHYGVTAEGTGGGPGFLSCLNDVVIPLVDQIYRTQSGDRAIAGHSRMS